MTVADDFLPFSAISAPSSERRRPALCAAFHKPAKHLRQRTLYVAVHLTPVRLSAITRRNAFVPALFFEDFRKQRLERLLVTLPFFEYFVDDAALHQGIEAAFGRGRRRLKTQGLLDEEPERAL